MDIAIREGRSYLIVDETEDSVQVVEAFEFEDQSDPILRLWWDKKCCIILRDFNPLH
jgi:hypothetical protein